MIKAPITFVLMLLLLAMGGAAYGQKVDDRIEVDDGIEASQGELSNLKENLAAAKERQRRLSNEIQSLDKDKASINKALIVSAKRAQKIEQQITTHESKILRLEESRMDLRGSLISKRALLSEVLASLQRMGRHPPPAILVRPEDALKSVRSAILLGSVVPEVRGETQTLLAELTQLAQISSQMKTQKQALANNLNALAEDEQRLTLLLTEKESLAARSRKQLLNERRKAEDLAKKATSLEDLIAKIESRIASAKRAAAAARNADKRRKLEEEKRLALARESLSKGIKPADQNPGEPKLKLDAKFSDMARIEPAIAFGKAKGLLPLPVSGERVISFGDKLKNNTKAPNMAIATRINSRVRAPSDGWIVYAGNFRSYGQLVIINAGDNYHLVMFGLEQVNVSSGQFVLTGEPIGRMGAKQVAGASSLDLSSAKPVLYVEFRKDGKPIDPSPWWAKNEQDTASVSKTEGPKNDS